MHVLVARLPGRYESRTDMKVKGDHDRRTGRGSDKERSRPDGDGAPGMLTRGEDENAIDLSSIALPDHVLCALISIDLLSLLASPGVSLSSFPRLRG